MGRPTAYYYGKRADLFEQQATQAFDNGEITKGHALMARAEKYRGFAGQLHLDVIGHESEASNG